jgi:hypothetical protein
MEVAEMEVAAAVAEMEVAEMEVAAMAAEVEARRTCMYSSRHDKAATADPGRTSGATRNPDAQRLAALSA